MTGDFTHRIAVWSQAMSPVRWVAASLMAVGPPLLGKGVVRHPPRRQTPFSAGLSEKHRRGEVGSPQGNKRRGRPPDTTAFPERPAGL